MAPIRKASRNETRSTLYRPGMYSGGVQTTEYQPGMYSGGIVPAQGVISPQRCGVVRTGRGVGDHLFDVLKEIGVKPATGCDCEKLRREMNQLGPDGCQELRGCLIKKLQKNAGKYGIAEWAVAGWSALWQGKPLSLGGLLDLAIERSGAGQQ